MIFIATLTGIVFAMILMALSILLGRGAIRKGCGKECECLDQYRKKREGRTT